jgi:hypothetical protein
MRGEISSTDLNTKGVSRILALRTCIQAMHNFSVLFFLGFVVIPVVQCRR